GLVARVEGARELVVAPAVGEELPRGRGLRLLRISREGLIHPVVLRPRLELEAVGDALGHDEEIALAVGDGAEGGLERPRALVDEEHEGGRVVLEEVVHGRGGRRHVHGGGAVGDQASQAPGGGTARRRLRLAKGVMDTAEGTQRRLPVGCEARAVEEPALLGQPVGGRVEMVGMADLAREAAAAVLLLVDVTEERARVWRSRHDAHLGDTGEVFELFHDVSSSCAPDIARLIRYVPSASYAPSPCPLPRWRRGVRWWRRSGRALPRSPRSCRRARRSPRGGGAAR